jgi:hypothetical protein
MIGVDEYAGGSTERDRSTGYRWGSGWRWRSIGGRRRAGKRVVGTE